MSHGIGGKQILGQIHRAGNCLGPRVEVEGSMVKHWPSNSQSPQNHLTVRFH